MITVLCLARNEPNEMQNAELRRLYDFFGDVQIVTISETVTGADRVRQLVRKHDATVLDAGASSLLLLAELTHPLVGLLIPVIRPVMRGQAFDHSERVLEVKVEAVTKRLS